MPWNRYWWPAKNDLFNIEILARFNPHEKTWEVALPSEPEIVHIEMSMKVWEIISPEPIGGEE